jgi:glyoxylase-like metal-dependent hydrolase (beta-lactamase superfamily II)
MKLDDSLHRVGSDLVNTYLIEDERGLTVIDTGIPGQWQDLTAELGAMGRSPEDIRGVILTHGDTDHRGFAERLRSEYGVTISVHEADAALARGEITKRVSWGTMKLGPTLSFIWYAGRRGGLRVPGVAEVATVVGGETLDLPGDPRVIHVPGHTPGSIAIASVGAVFVGDAFTTRHVLTGVEGPQPAPFTMDQEQALASLARLEELETTWVLPGHGPPWRGQIADAVTLVRRAAAGGRG